MPFQCLPDVARAVPLVADGANDAERAYWAWFQASGGHCHPALALAPLPPPPTTTTTTTTSATAPRGRRAKKETHGLQSALPAVVVLAAPVRAGTALVTLPWASVVTGVTAGPDGAAGTHDDNDDDDDDDDERLMVGPHSSALLSVCACIDHCIVDVRVCVCVCLSEPQLAVLAALQAGGDAHAATAFCRAASDGYRALLIPGQPSLLSV
jgi:hypothetical protein